MRPLLAFWLAIFLTLITSSLMAQPITPSTPETKTANFAGGCFWCTQAEFDSLRGVISTTVGYTGGTVVDPTYEQVGTGTTGHKEGLQVKYDPSQVSYAQLLDIFWSNVDPLDAGGQFCDRGEQYTAAIFYDNDEEKKLAEESVVKVQKKLGQKVATQILPVKPFYAAEDYHQEYYKKNPLRYKLYRTGCGRDAKLDKVWGQASGQ